MVRGGVVAVGGYELSAGDERTYDKARNEVEDEAHGPQDDGLLMNEGVESNADDGDYQNADPGHEVLCKHFAVAVADEERRFVRRHHLSAGRNQRGRSDEEESETQTEGREPHDDGQQTSPLERKDEGGDGGEDGGNDEKGGGGEGEGKEKGENCINAQHYS